MSSPERSNRRTFFKQGVGIALTVPIFGLEASPPLNSEEGVTAPEDLMKEHGVLNRCLLIYEEAMRRIQTRQEVAPRVFNETAQLIQKFVENYHEQNEEKYIFPEFERAKKLQDLVETLKVQHRAGRQVTREILRFSNPTLFRETDNQQRLIELCQSFIKMYRPHEAREDTILFPALRTILSAKEVAELGERMEEDEKRLLGDEGFERSLDQVVIIEKQLGIYDLKKFTPKN